MTKRVVAAEFRKVGVIPYLLLLVWLLYVKSIFLETT